MPFIGEQPKQRNRALSFVLSFALALCISVAACLALASSAWANAPSPHYRTGMARTGDAMVVGLVVDFPDYQFAPDDNAQALDALINQTPDPTHPLFPYEGLNAYYQRASYGQLNIAGTAFAYTAQHERSYYSNVEDLFIEALTALDPSIDFSRFDANDDGFIDAVYLHFAGPDEGRDSPWWDSSKLAFQGAQFDGKTLLNMVTLRNPSNTFAGGQRINHETGHVLGAPDLYTGSGSQQSGTVERTGTLSWDLMDNDLGDIDGFFKWQFGWIDDSQIIRVVANESGITVTQGTQLLQSVPPTQNESGVIMAFADVDLSAFDTDNLDECGGFIIVSNAEASMYSSYYLIQYEQFAGNQSVSWLDPDTATPNPIPSGFRVYRIQGETAPDGSYFVHDNTGSVNVHDQLLEVLDVDQAEEHQGQLPGSTSYATARDSAGVNGFGCLLAPGTIIDGTGLPSTSFMEDPQYGFTGLSFEALSCDQSCGTIRIGYSNEHAPDYSDFTLSCTSGEFLNCARLEFEAPWSIKQNPEIFLNQAAHLRINGQDKAATEYVEGNKVTVLVSQPPTELRASDVCTVEFAENLFIIGNAQGAHVYSAALSCNAAVGPMAAIKAAGDMPAFDTPCFAPHYSSTAVKDGVAWTVWSTETAAYLTRMDANDPATAQTTELAGCDLPENYPPLSNLGTLHCCDNGIAVLATPLDGGVSLFWIDLESSQVFAASTVETPMGECSVSSDATVYVQTVDTSGLSHLVRLATEAGSGVDRQDVSDFEGQAPAKMMPAGVSDSGQALTYLHVPVQLGQLSSQFLGVVLDESQMESLFAQGSLTQQLIDSAYARVPLHFENYGELVDAAALPDGGLLYLASSFQLDASGGLRPAVDLVRCAADGSIVAQVPITSKSGLPVSEMRKLVFDGNKSVAVQSVPNGYDDLPYCEMQLFNIDALDASSVQCLATNVGVSETAGFWSPNGGWVALEWHMNDSTFNQSMGYYLTDAPVGPVDPTPTPTPTPMPTTTPVPTASPMPLGPGGPTGTGTLAQNGDSEVPFAIASMGLAASALVLSLSLSARRQSA